MFRAHVTNAAAAAACLLLVAGCSQETADRAAKAVENAPAQIERQTEQTAAVLDDATITAKVKSALIADPAVKAFTIDVDTRANVVTLKGTVATEDASKQAERLARGVEGVKDVSNNLLVQGT